MQRFLSIDVLHFKSLAIFAALSVYAVFGSPTPDGFGFVEGVVGALLICVIGARGAVAAVNVRSPKPFWFAAGQALLVYGIVVGVIGGLMQGHDIGLMARDIIPFLFLFLPLFLMSSMRDKRSFSMCLLAGALLIGLGFSVRAALLSDDALYYLGNSPCVLLAALLGIGYGVERAARGINLQNLGIAAAAFSGSALCILPLIESVQRASLGAVFIYSILVVVFAFIRAPRRVLLLFLAALPVLLWLGDAYLMQVWDRIAGKSDLVGGNKRIEEWQAVWAHINHAPLSVIFGHGWGAGFSSPAVADIRVNFTHSLLSSMILKIGVVGLGLCVAYLYGLVRILWGQFGRSTVFVLGIAAPFVIDVFLYGAYKSLDFGLLLALIPALLFIKPSVSSQLET